MNLKWLSISVSTFLISLLLPQPQTATLNYVTPTDGCPGDKTPCYTLEEYANQQDTYFINNSTFYFFPGLHKLEDSIRIINTNNLSFCGYNEMVKIAFNSAATIQWENCSDIEIKSLVITLVDDFTYSIVFECTHSVEMFNISILGNGNNGCSSILSNTSMLNITNSQFIGIHGCLGAALMIISSSITFTGSNTFKNNIAMYGGAIYLHNSVLIIQADRANFFTNNSIKRYKDSCSTCNLVQQIEANHGCGGAVYSTFSTIRLTGQSKVTFSENKALPTTGDYYYYGYGGALAIVNGSFITKVSVLFYNNKAENLGGAILLEDVNSKFLGSITFDNNTADTGGALHIAHTNISFNVDQSENNLSSSITTFQNNIAYYFGGAIEGDKSILTFAKSVLFEANTVHGYGGAMSLSDTSKLILAPKLNISFTNNHAYYSGGALFIDDFQCSPGSLVPLECFLSIQSSDPTTENIILHFENNSAGSTGSTLYGGQLNKCRLYYRTNYTVDKCGNRPCHDYCDDALKLFMNMSRIVLYNKSESATNISSQAEQIKFCQDGNIIMNSYRYISLYPGEQFNVELVALGQTGFPVPTTIFNENSYEISLFPSSQSITGACYNLSLQLYSSVNNTYTSFDLYPQNPCQGLINGLTLDIFIEPCPLGFELSENQLCSCNKKLLKFTQKCSIDTSTVSIEREKNDFWIFQMDLDVLVIHEFRCPLDYCTSSLLNVTLSDPSVQCDFNRTGIVCGQCRKNFSLVLGSLHCIPCNNNYTALILLFMIAGVALITITFLFRLTVSVGTLSGLLFYSNIIQANHQAYFPRATINFFTIFTSWLNLDLGIETCFYDGMDIYTYSWLQFLFPFYVWFLVGCIILACRYSQSIAQRFGQNPVAVLATLLLMSYSKILSAVIVPLTWTYLTYYYSTLNETRSVVWMYDASIPHFGEPKHTALGLFAILCIVVFVLPYISLLFFGYWLQSCSNWWILSWLNKIKPFMDAYHAPYRKHTRYWTGLLLLSRLGLFLTFAINANGSESVNILVVSSVSIALLAIQKRVYQHWLKDALESSFLLNLGIFSVATFYLKEEPEDDESQLILSSISVGIAFVTFLGILLFHISLMLPFIQISLLLSKILRITPAKDQTRAEDKDATELQALPTSTEINIDLREPLLEITESQATT